MTTCRSSSIRSAVAINASGRIVHLVIHPILTVARDPEGRLGELDGAATAGLRESWMQIEITRGVRSRRPRPPDPHLVRVSSPMSAPRSRTGSRCASACESVVGELSRPPSPPVPPTELAEVEDFLRWLDEDNFTFLGFREYVFDGAAEPGARAARHPAR